MEYGKLEVTNGKIVEKWRNDRRVQRVTLKLDGDAVRDAIQKEIIRQAKKQGILVPDLENNYYSDPWLQIGTTASGDYNEYDYPFICNAVLSYYVDIPDTSVTLVESPESLHYTFTDKNEKYYFEVILLKIEEDGYDHPVEDYSSVIMEDLDIAMEKYYTCRAIVEPAVPITTACPESPKSPHYAFTDNTGYCSICDRVFPEEAL